MTDINDHDPHSLYADSYPLYRQYKGRKNIQHVVTGKKGFSECYVINSQIINY